MSCRLNLKVDPSAVSMAAAIRTAAQAAPLFVLTGRALGDLPAELGSMEATLRHLLEVAEARNKPVRINLETGFEKSSSAFLALRGRSEERLAGWIAGHHAELEREFGEAVRVGTDAGARGRMW